jgi:nucleoside-diphosphate-sugar epimerase
MVSREIRTCFVTGGTGFIGSHLVDFLLARGVEVRCLVRRPSNLGWLDGKSIQVVQGDLDNIDALKEGVSGADAVFHLAGALAAGNRKEYFRTNAEGCRNIGRIARDCSEPPDVFVYVSSQAVSGPSGTGEPVKESALSVPITDYGRSKLKGENILQDMGALPLVVVRPPTVIGPRDREAFIFFRLASMGIFPILNRRSRISMIFVDDLVKGIWQTAESGRIGERYFIANPIPLAMAQLPGILGKALGRKVKGIFIPRAVLTAAAAGSELWGKVSGRMTVFNRDKVNELTASGWVCSTRKAKAELAFTAQTPLETAFVATANWYRETDWLK